MRDSNAHQFSPCQTSGYQIALTNSVELLQSAIKTSWFGFKKTKLFELSFAIGEEWIESECTVSQPDGVVLKSISVKADFFLELEKQHYWQTYLNEV